MFKKYFLILIIFIFYLIKIKALPPPPLNKNNDQNLNLTQNSTQIYEDVTIHPTRPCPPYYNRFCYNKGKCYAAFVGNGNYRPFCICAKNFHGERCEYLFNPDIYGF